MMNEVSRPSLVLHKEAFGVSCHRLMLDGGWDLGWLQGRGVTSYLYDDKEPMKNVAAPD